MNDYVLYGLIVVVIVLLLVILFKLGNEKSNSNSEYFEKEISNKIENLLRDNKDVVTEKIAIFEKDINKEQNEFKTTFLKENAELKSNIIEINAKNIEKLEKDINEFKVFRAEINKEQNEFKTSFLKESASFKSNIDLSNTKNIEKIDKVISDFKKLQTDIMINISNELEKVNKRVEDRLTEGFKNTNETFTNVMNRLSVIDETQKKIEGLTANIGSLQDVLSDKKTRGNFGEVQLEIILSSAFGENQGSIYQLQKTLSNKLKCDAFIKLPNDALGMAIDSKFPLENYKKMVSATSDEFTKKESTRLFKENMKKHINDISKKYIIEGETTNQAIMFLPAEAIFAEVNAYHQDIIELAQKSNVVITSPTTIMALFKVILLANRDVEMAKHARQLQQQLYELSGEFKRYSERWNKLQGSIEKVTTDVKNINATTDKINNKFDKIKNASIDPDIIEVDCE